MRKGKSAASQENIEILDARPARRRRGFLRTVRRTKRRPERRFTGHRRMKPPSPPSGGAETARAHAHRGRQASATPVAWRQAAPRGLKRPPTAICRRRSARAPSPSGDGIERTAMRRHAPVRVPPALPMAKPSRQRQQAGNPYKAPHNGRSPSPMTKRQADIPSRNMNQ